MDMRPRWSCPDLAPDKRLGLPLPVVGTDFVFDECPAYYLRTGGMDMPATHLLEDGTHVANLVADWAFEVESGSRNVDTLSAKGREAVHLYLHEKTKRDRKSSDMRMERLRRERRG